LFAAWCVLWAGLLARKKRVGKIFIIIGLAGVVVLASSVMVSERMLGRELVGVVDSGKKGGDK